MRRALLLGVTLGLCGLATTAHAEDQPADFSGYRIPTQDWFIGSASALGSLRAQTLDQGATAWRDRSGSAETDLGAAHSHDSESLQHYWKTTVTWNGDANFLRRLTEIETGTGSLTDDLHSAIRAMSERWAVSGATRLYPWSSPAGLEANVTLSGAEQQNWSHSGDDALAVTPVARVRTVTSAGDRHRLYQIQAIGSLRAGYGRVRDASTVYRVWLIERRLIADGTLSRPLSQATRDRLARLFAVQSSFSYVHDLPEKTFWAEVEKVLRDDGALANGSPSAYGLFHAIDPLMGARSGFGSRLIGGFAGPVFMGSHLHVIQWHDRTISQRLEQADTLVAATEGSTTTRSTLDADQALAGIEAEWHHPYGVRWQVDVSATALGEVRGLARATTVQGDLALGYQLGERWNTELSAHQDREVARRNVALDQWTTTVLASLRYYVEDHWSLDLAVGQQQRAQTQPGPRAYDRNATVSLGVHYGTGRLDAPGLIQPVRPLPVGAP